jgi:hypothetical protein
MWVVFPLVVLVQITSFADVGALAGGADLDVAESLIGHYAATEARWDRRAGCPARGPLIEHSDLAAIGAH